METILIHPDNRIRKTSSLAVFIALGVALGYLFSAIPNVELVTSTVFLSGYLFGPLYGAVVGALTEAIYSAFNPYGAAPLHLWTAQVISFAIIGAVGGWIGSLHIQSRIRLVAVLGFSGFVCTLFYALTTSLAYFLMAGQTLPILISGLIQGIGFYIVHIVTNTMIFAILLPILIRRLQKTG
jgi:uncharacterized membrane protein